MKSLKFSKKSIHYRLALLWCSYSYNISDNICGYFWQVFFGTLSAIGMFIVIIALLSLSVVFPLVYLVVALQTGIWFKAPDEVVAGLCFDASIIFIVLCGIVSYYYTEYKERKRKRDYQRKSNGEYIETHSFIVEIYRKFKDKTCAKIEFM